LMALSNAPLATSFAAASMILFLSMEARGPAAGEKLRNPADLLTL
jgi:hypothetical protein